MFRKQKKNALKIPEEKKLEKTESHSDDSASQQANTTPVANNMRFRKLVNPFVILKPSYFKEAIKSKRWPILVVYAVLLLVIVAGIIPASRYAIAGSVVKKSFSLQLLDSETQKPVTEATVTIGSVSAKTDSKGEVRLERIGVGKKNVRVEKQNYTTVDSQVFVGFTVPKTPQTFSMIATGRQVFVSVKQYINGVNLADVSLLYGDSTSLTDEAGIAQIIVPVGETTAAVRISKDGFVDRDVSIVVDETAEPIEQNRFTLTPMGRIYMLSKQSGKIDVIKTNLDGTDRQVVLAGTGFEQEYSTVLVASRDWKHIAVRSIRNSANQESINYINTTDDSVREADAGDATFGIVGWYNDSLVYTVNRNVYNQSEKYKLKSYNASNDKITLLEASSYADEGYACENYCTNRVTQTYIDRAALVEGGVIYAVDTYKTFTNTSSKIYQVSVNGENKKQIWASDDCYVTNLLGYDPIEAYFNCFKTSDNKDYTYEVTFDGKPEEVTDVLEKTKFSNGSYNKYLLSPSGNNVFWSESRDGKNVFFTGNKTGEDPKELFRLPEFSAYGWYTDDYLLLAKNQSEMYIVPAEGGVPVKVSDYHKPDNNYRPYGYGYGG